MKRKHNLRKIISKRSYSTEEIAELLGVHIQTVRTWRKEGLNPIEAKSSPFLFLGSEIRQFLSNEIKKQRVKLLEGEFYCLRCRKAVKPKTTSIIDRNIIIGKGKQSVFIEGVCPVCKLRLRRFSTLSNLKKEKKDVVEISKPTQQLKGQMNLFESNGED